MKIIIDAGHGGKDPGACYFGKQEKDLNLTFSLLLAEVLSYKHDVILTRKDDTFIPLDDRIKNPGDIFISIHHNASGNPRAKGFECWYYKNARFAKKLGLELVNSVALAGLFTAPSNRGVRCSEILHVLRANMAIPVLFELGFMSSKQDMKVLNNCARQYCNALKNGLESFWINNIGV